MQEIKNFKYLSDNFYQIYFNNDDKINDQHIEQLDSFIVKLRHYHDEIKHKHFSKNIKKRKRQQIKLNKYHELSYSSEQLFNYLREILIIIPSVICEIINEYTYETIFRLYNCIFNSDGRIVNDTMIIKKFNKIIIRDLYTDFTIKEIILNIPSSCILELYAGNNTIMMMYDSTLTNGNPTSIYKCLFVDTDTEKIIDCTLGFTDIPNIKNIMKIKVINYVISIIYLKNDFLKFMQYDVKENQLIYDINLYDYVKVDKNNLFFVNNKLYYIKISNQRDQESNKYINYKIFDLIKENKIIKIHENIIKIKDLYNNFQFLPEDKFCYVSPSNILYIRVFIKSEYIIAKFNLNNGNFINYSKYDDDTRTYLFREPVSKFYINGSRFVFKTNLDSIDACAEIYEMMECVA
jgi:hypothetical protein